MDSKTLGYFLEAYDEGSFAQAAKRIPISSQGLTKALHAMEDELNAPLFDNSTGKQVPTAFGERLYEYALKQKLQYKELLSDFEYIKRAKAGVLNVGFSTGIRGAVDFDLLSSFEKEYPNVQVNQEDLPDYICDEKLEEGKLEEGKLDFAFSVFPYDERFETRELFCDTHYLWISKDHPLATKDEVCIDDLKGEAIVLVGTEFKCRQSLEEACKQAGFEPTIVKTSSEMAWLHRFAYDGEGLALTVRHQVELFDDDNSVKGMPLLGLPWRFGISYKKGVRLSTVEWSFLTYALRMNHGKCCEA